MVERGEAIGEGSDCIAPCGSGKEFSLFTLTKMLEGFEQTTAGSFWLLRRRDHFRRYSNNPSGLHHGDSDGGGEKWLHSGCKCRANKTCQ